MIGKKTIQIYTDGACSGNPGPGGWGAILLYKEARKELSGGEPNTTNNRMEMMAAIEALAAVKEPCIVELYSDSAYLCNAFNQGWIHGWKARGWMTANKKPVENQDLWNQLLCNMKPHEVSFHKVKGHANNALNNRCDELARGAIQRQDRAD